MLRFTAYAIPLLILLMALFGVAVEVLDLEPAPGAVLRLAVSEPTRVPATFTLIAWTMEACGLLALFLVAQGRSGIWWLDGLTAGWLAWVFRGPLLVVTITVATRQSQSAWWKIALGWWVLYSICGLALAWLYRRVEGDDDAPLPAAAAAAAVTEVSPSAEPVEVVSEQANSAPPADSVAEIDEDKNEGVDEDPNPAEAPREEKLAATADLPKD